MVNEYNFGLTEDSLMSMIADMRMGNVAALIGQTEDGSEEVVRVNLLIADSDVFTPGRLEDAIGEELCDCPADECTCDE